MKYKLGYVRMRILKAKIKWQYAWGKLERKIENQIMKNTHIYMNENEEV